MKKLWFVVFGIFIILLNLMSSDFEKRINDLRNLIKNNGYSALLLNSQRNFSWLTGGGENIVVLSSELGTVSLLLTENDLFLLTPNDEKKRFLEEELKGFNIKVKEYPWYKGIDGKEPFTIIKNIVKNNKIACDIPKYGFKSIEPEIAKLRLTLSENDIKRYKALGRDSAEAAEEVAFKIKKGMSEEEIRAMVSYELYKRNIIPTVLLIGVDSGIYNYRHVIPKGRRLKNFAQINICAKRGGLVVALTRLVYFGDIPQELKDKQEVAEQVYCEFLYNLKDGVKYSDIFKNAIDIYKKYGYENEWKNHHQGGSIGYNEREFIFTLNSNLIVKNNQAFAFNPTLPGAKVEDTVILKNNRVEIITYTGKWPYKRIEYKGKKIFVPEILVVK